MQDRPSKADALEHGEKLLLVGVRAIAVGRADCPGLRARFLQTCGAAGDEAFAALFTLVRHLGWRANRRFVLHMPGCPCLSPDEQALIGLFASAQEAELTGREEPLQMRFAELLRASAPPAIVDAAKRLARLLASNGHILPDREAGAAVHAFEDAQRVYH